jgi:hypothetical protein
VDRCEVGCYSGATAMDWSLFFALQGWQIIDWLIDYRVRPIDFSDNLFGKPIIKEVYYLALIQEGLFD